MAINQNPFFHVSNLVDMIVGQYTDPAAQALLEAQIWEHQGLRMLASCADKDQTSPTVQNTITQAMWKLEVASNYLDAAIELEQMR